MYNVLRDSIVRVVSESAGAQNLSMPQIYAALMADDILSFCALRPHQRHGWHAFLVQLASLAMLKAGLSKPPVTASEWRTLLRGLTPEYAEDEAWQLANEDIFQPAFMQPPAKTSTRVNDYKSRVDTPDRLDILVTAKNHDLKASTALQAYPDDWLFALITLQTMGGFSGAGNYGISRMNGGFGSRTAFSLTPSLRPGSHVKRDIGALLARRQQIIDAVPVFHSQDISKIALLWTIPWDGLTGETLTLDQLDPFYIEICRRVRLYRDAKGALYGLRAASKAARLAAKPFQGVVGDPWMPVNKKAAKCLTLAKGGFTYKRIADYLSPDAWEKPLLFAPTSDELVSQAPVMLVARGMVRGSGKTEGYYERIIPFRERTTRALGNYAESVALGEIAQERIQNISTIAGIVRHAILAFLAGGDPGKASGEHRSRANLWTRQLDKIVDTAFFEALQDEFAADVSDERSRIRVEWLNGILDSARKIVEAATYALPCPSIHRYRAQAIAQNLFEGRIRASRELPPEMFRSQGERA